MPWAIPVAIGGSAVLGALASEDAASKQADATKQASAQQMQMYNQNRADLSPWRSAGQAGLNKLADLLGIDTYNTVTTPGAPVKAGGFMSGMLNGVSQPTTTQVQNPRSADFGSLMQPFSLDKFQADPGYQFTLDQGQRGIQNSAAAKGSLMSGATMKALTRFNQDTASNQFQNAYGRYTNDQTNTYNRLASLAGMGQNSAAQQANMGTQVGNSIAQNTIGAGNALAGGTVGGANALTNGLGSYLNYTNSQNLLSRLAPTSSSYAPTNFNTTPLNYGLGG